MARKDGALPARVHGLRTRIEHWRRHRDSRAMPEKLWEAAVFLARLHGIAPISRALRLDYGALKRRVAGAEAGVEKRGPTRFVELGAESLLGRSTIDGPAVELWGADGSRLVVRLSTHERAEVLVLAAALWKQR